MVLPGATKLPSQGHEIFQGNTTTTPLEAPLKSLTNQQELIVSALKDSEVTGLGEGMSRSQLMAQAKLTAKFLDGTVSEK